MSNRNQRYWRERAVRIKLEQSRRNDNVIRQSSILYRRTIRNINNQLDSFQRRYAPNGNFDIHEMNQLLSRSEQIGWHRAVREFQQEANSAGFADKLQNNYYRTRISRLEHMKLQTEMELDRLAHGNEKMLRRHLETSVTEVFNRSIDEFGVAFDVQSELAHFNPDTVKHLVNNPQHGHNFSENIWGNKRSKLARELNLIINNGMMMGTSVDNMTRQLRGRVEVDQRHARMLIRTESAHAAEQTTALAYERMGVREFEFSSALEVGTCEHCAEKHGEIHKVSDREVGVNYPPIHPNCLCTTVPVVDMGDGERDDRAEQDREEWKSKFTDEERKAHKNRASDRKQMREYRRLGVDVPRNLADFQDMKYNRPNEWSTFKRQVQVFRSIDREVARDPKLTRADGRNARQVHRDFGGHNVEMSAHACVRWGERSDNSGLTVESAVALLNTPHTHIDTRKNRPVWVQGRDRFILETDKSVVVTYIYTSKAYRIQKNWREV